VAQRDELVILLEVGEVEVRDPVDRPARQLAALLEAGNERVEVHPARRLVEAADPDVDGMDRAAPDGANQVVANCLDLQSGLHHLGVVARHGPGRLEAEEVGRVEQEDVERVRLDPLPAVHEPAQDADPPIDLDT
jgi:hypothetical protein